MKSWLFLKIKCRYHELIAPVLNCACLNNSAKQTYILLFLDGVAETESLKSIIYSGLYGVLTKICNL